MDSVVLGFIIRIFMGGIVGMGGMMGVRSFAGIWGDGDECALRR